MARQQLLFDKGMSNTPSDAVCSDNALALSVGLTYSEGEHRVVQAPAVYIEDLRGVTLLYVHKLNDMTRYIGVVEQGDSSYSLYWFKRNGKVMSRLHELNKPGEVSFVCREKPKVTSVGKTLIVTCKEGIFYFLWKDDGYKPLGNKLPEIDIEFAMSNNDMGGARLSAKGTTEAVSYDPVNVSVKIKESKKTSFNDFVYGLYAKNKKDINHNMKAFSRPFFARAAYEMYDGSYYMTTQPVLLFPSITRSSYLAWNMSASDLTIRSSNDNLLAFIMYTNYAGLYFRLNSDITAFDDIIKDVAIFITDEVEIYDLSVDAILESMGSNEKFADSIQRVGGWNRFFEFLLADKPAYEAMKRRSAKDIMSDLSSSSVFYHLCNIGKKSTNKYVNAADFIKPNVIENITTQTQLTGDFYERAPLFPQFVFPYNSRINIANVSRGFFEGFDFFLPYDNDRAHKYTFYVTIKTDNGDIVVSHEKTIRQKQGLWFYYPDPRASHVVIKRDDTFILDEPLTEHTGLNGSYFFRGLPTKDYEETPLAVAPLAQHITPTTGSPTELLPNYIITSEVNNPFVFKAEGYNRVGAGKVLGMATQTQALSQGQFGQYPLLVFSDEGIWAMSVGSDGLFTSIHPMSREVCNNVQSITQTDGAVFFSSEKGLMMVAGANVKCVTLQMNGRTSELLAGLDWGVEYLSFVDFLREAFIAYDYRDSLLWVFREGARYAFLYNIKSGTVSLADFGALVGGRPIGVVGDYPDALIVYGRVGNAADRAMVCSLLSRGGDRG